jgi:hypothetical protein
MISSWNTENLTVQPAGSTSRRTQRLQVDHAGDHMTESGIASKPIPSTVWGVHGVTFVFSCGRPASMSASCECQRYDNATGLRARPAGHADRSGGHARRIASRLTMVLPKGPGGVNQSLLV